MIEIIDLRPKTFEVLRQLAESPGQLVSKDALYRAVWHDVIVGDNSLSQCIHELRQILGDTAHRVIKTVPRRGYLLDAQAVEPSTPLDGLARAPMSIDAPSPTSGHAVVHKTGYDRRTTWTVVAGALIVVVAAFLVPNSLVASIRQHVAAVLPALTPAAGNPISEPDARRIAAFALEKELPLPVYRIRAPAEDVAENLRKFVGVWVSSSGWVNSHRQFMLIVTNVSKDGTATGYIVNGPAAPHSRAPGPAFAGSFTGHIANGTLRYDGNAGMHLASLTPDGQMEFKLIFQEGGTGVVMLDPAWTLPRQAGAFDAPQQALKTRTEFGSSVIGRSANERAF